MHFNKLILWLIVTFVFHSTVIVESYKFLAILPTTFRSHFVFGASLMKALAKKGHEVYVISPYPLLKPTKNYHDLPFTYDRSALQDDGETARNIYQLSIHYQENHMAKAIFESRHVQQLMFSNHTFDAVLCEVFYSEALLGFSEHFKAPLIGLSSFGYVPWTSDMIGSPSPISYVPSIFTEYSDHMSMWQRLINIWRTAQEKYTLYRKNLPVQAALYNKFFPHAKRDMYTVHANVAALLINTHISLTYPRPYVPNHVAVGGLHITRKIKPLPEDLEKFISDAKDGVVFFSMGTNIASKAYLSSRYLSILQAFKKIKQRVLWKLEDNKFIGRHNNVLIRSWFPQQDILAHENVVAFITQGGILSITESIYHATPIIGIPVLHDQYSNMGKIKNAGAGVSLSHNYVTAEDIVGAVELVTSNEDFALSVRKMSARYRDQPILPLDLAVYWVERVARQKGAKHLRCAGLDLNFIQYHNLDAAFIIYSGLLQFVLIVLFLIFFGLPALYRKFVRRQTPQPSTDTKQKKKKKRN